MLLFSYARALQSKGRNSNCRDQRAGRRQLPSANDLFSSHSNHHLIELCADSARGKESKDEAALQFHCPARETGARNSEIRIGDGSTSRRTARATGRIVAIGDRR